MMIRISAAKNQRSRSQQRHAAGKIRGRVSVRCIMLLRNFQRRAFTTRRKEWIWFLLVKKINRIPPKKDVEGYVRVDLLL